MRLLCLLACLAFACGDDDGSTDDPPVDGGGTDGFVADRDGFVPGIDGFVPMDGGGDEPDMGPPVDPVDGAGEVTLVASSYMGDDFGFLEGPHWQGDRLVFSDLIFSTPARQTIYALDADDELSIVLRPSEGANGSGTAMDGDHITCLQVGRRVARVTEAGALETLFERYEGDRLNAPNDLVFASSGRWYFTDPGYGVEGPDREIDVHGLYLVDGDTLTRVWDGTTSQRPNGVALSPDDRTLYLADTADAVVRAFDVAADGTLSSERTFASDASGADGMTVDEAGNLYVATGSGVRVYAPDGTLWGTLDVPMTPANCAFGGADRRTLYITARTGLYRVAMPIPGIEGR